MEFGIGVRSKSRTTLAAVAAVGVAVTLTTGCGSSDGASDADAEAIAEVDPRFAALPENGKKLIEGAVTPSQPRHVVAAMGLEMAANGQSLNNPPDLAKPMMVTDVDADGETHTVFDLSNSFGALGAPEGETPEVKAEQWTDADWAYMEYIGFDRFLGTGTPFDDLMAPGLFKVDLDRLDQEAGLDTETALSQATGQDIDLAPYLYSLAEDADSAAPDPDDPSKMRIETDAAALTKQNTDGSVPMLNGFPGIGDSTDSEEMLDMLGRIPVVYIYSTDDEGRIADLTVQIEMSDFFKSMAADTPGADTSTLDGATMQFSTLMSIDYDTTTDVTMPTGVDDDRTDAFISALETINAMSDSIGGAAPETTGPDNTGPDNTGPDATSPETTTP